MHTESHKHLILIKQSLLEKKVAAQRNLDEIFNQEDAFTGDVEALNNIIDTCDEIIDAIDNELPKRLVVKPKPEQTLINHLMLKFIRLGWVVDRIEDNNEVTLIVRKPVREDGKQGVLQFCFSDLIGDQLTDVNAFVVTHELTATAELKEF